MARSAGAFDVLVKSLKSRNIRCKEAASTALIHLSETTDDLKVLCFPPHACSAAWCHDNVMTQTIFVQGSALCSPDGLSVLISLIRYEVSSNINTGICENCAWILGNISCHQIFHEPIRQAELDAVVQ